MRKSNRIVVDTDPRTKEKLMEMAVIKRMSQKELVENFINQEYEKIKPSK